MPLLQTKSLSPFEELNQTFGDIKDISNIKTISPEQPSATQTKKSDRGQFLVDRWSVTQSTRTAVVEDVEVLIIGGGYGAQLTAVRLIEAGVTSIRMIEKGSNFGGAWYWNRYPGAQCDIESYIYMPLLEELGYMPTERYAHSDELLRHAESIGRKYNLYSKTLLQTEVTSLTWSDDQERWIAKTNRGDIIRAQFSVSATGVFHQPKLPNLPFEKFEGASFHSSRWDYDYTKCDNLGNLTGLADKKVAIIGTGATAVQIVPHLANDAKDLYVFQRTPVSVDVRRNRATDPEFAKSLGKGWQTERMRNFDLVTSGTDSNPEHDMVKDSWTKIMGKLYELPKPSVDAVQAAAKRQSIDSEHMKQIRARCDKEVRDPQTAEALKPYYNWLCKRPCLHDTYLDAFNKPSVHLIDTKGKGVSDITAKGIVANEEEFEVDCIVYATGFELATSYSHRSGIEIHGRNGRSLDDKWAKGPSTFQGMVVTEFPNCFMMSATHASLSANNLSDITTKAKHIAYMIKTAKLRGIETFEATVKAEEAWAETSIALSGPKQALKSLCMPGLPNKAEVPAPLKVTSYGTGPIAYANMLEDWRNENKLEGLKLTYAARN